MPEPVEAKAPSAALRLLLKAVTEAKKPNRTLDAMIATSLPEDVMLDGRRLGERRLSLAFTRSVECADRFIKIAFPGWDWSVGSNTKTGDYHATVWGPDGSDDIGNGATPALAILAAALACAIEEGGYRRRPRCA
jgi:hypothetical protein